MQQQQLNSNPDEENQPHITTRDSSCIVRQTKTKLRPTQQRQTKGPIRQNQTHDPSHTTPNF